MDDEDYLKDEQTPADAIQLGRDLAMQHEAKMDAIWIDLRLEKPEIDNPDFWRKQ